MKKLIELFETQIKLDKENRINYSILNAKNHLIKNLIELQINKDEKNKIDEYTIADTIKWTLRFLNSCFDYISKSQIERLENYFINYKDRNEKNNVIDLIYSTLRGDRNYHYLTYDHFKFFLTDLMIYFNHNLKIDKVELVKIYLKNISKN